MIHAILRLQFDTVHDIGWTLIHFLWQGLILAALLHLILPMFRSAVARHNWALGTLAAMALAPVMTFLFIHRTGSGGTIPETVSGSVLRSVESAVDTLTPMPVPFPWMECLVALWLVGIAVLSLRVLGGWYLADALRRRDTAVLSPDLLQRCRALQQRLAVTSPVQFLQSRGVSVPAVVGWFRPVILLPISAITGLPPEQLDALIMHELAHIRRLDAFSNVVLIAVETILFYHPAVWWVSRRVRIEREHCCDDVAVSNCGDATMYVEALTSLEIWNAAPALALGANGSALKDRAARLLGVSSDFRRFSMSAVVGLAVLCVVIAGVAMAQNKTQTTGSHFAIRVVDESVAGDVQKGPAGDDRASIAKPDNHGAEALWLKREGAIEGDVVARAHASIGSNGKPEIAFELTPEGQTQFAALTRANIGRRLAIVVNGTVVSAPVVRAEMADGKGVIDGGFTEADAAALAAEMTNKDHPAATAPGGAGVGSAGSPHLYYDLPEMMVNTDTLAGLKIRAVLEVNCADYSGRNCMPEVDAIENTLPAIIDGLQDEFRGLKPDDILNKESVARMRAALVRRVNVVTRPTGLVKDVFFKDLVIGSPSHMDDLPHLSTSRAPATNLYDLPVMTVNTSTLGLLKFQTVLEVACANPSECLRAVAPIEEVLPSIFESVQDELRGLKLEDFMSKDGMERVRAAILSHVNAVTRPPGVVKDVRFTEVIVINKH